MLGLNSDDITMKTADITEFGVLDGKAGLPRPECASAVVLPWAYFGFLESAKMSPFTDRFLGT